MKRHAAGAVMVLAFAYPPAAQTASISTENLYDLCTSRDSARATSCSLYILGAAEGAEISWLAGARRALFCIPDGVSNADLVATFNSAARRRLQETPSAGGVAAIATVLDSLERDYPCGAPARDGAGP